MSKDMSPKEESASPSEGSGMKTDSCAFPWSHLYDLEEAEEPEQGAEDGEGGVDRNEFEESEEEVEDRRAVKVLVVVFNP